MFEALRSIFTRPDATVLSMEPKLAVAALLVHLAAIDGTVTPAERHSLRAILMDHYELDEHQVGKLIAQATRQDQDSVDFYHFTSALSSLDDSEKLGIIRMMWQLVFSDGKNHELEDNMVWRIAELIGVSTRDRNVLRVEMSKA